MLETEIKKLTAAVEANTAAIEAVVSALNNGNTSADRPTPAPESTSESDKPQVLPPTKEQAKVEAKSDVTKADVVKAVVSLGKAKGREVVMQVFATYGITKLPEMKDTSKYAALLADLQKAEK